MTRFSQSSLRSVALGIVLVVSQFAVSADSPDVAGLTKELGSDDIQVRANAIEALGELGDQATAAAPALVELLAQQKARVTVGRSTAAPGYFAARALTRIGPTAGPAVLDGLAHSNVVVRRESATILGHLKFEPAMSKLIDALGERDRTIAGAASSALRHIGQSSVEPLLNVLVPGLDIPPPEKVWVNGENPDPDDPQTLPRQKRNYSAGVLGDLKEPRAIEPLMKAMDTDDNLFRRWAGSALGKMKSEACKAHLSREDVVTRLLSHLETDDVWVRGDMVRTLRNVSKTGRGPMIAALDHPDRRVRLELFKVWSTLRDDSRVVPALLKRIAAEDDDAASRDDPLAIRERSSALNILSGFLREFESRDEVLPLILSRLEDSAGAVRGSAAMSLTSMPEAWRTDPRVLPPLLKALETRSDTPTRNRVIYALGELRDARAVMPLAELLGSESLFESQIAELRIEMTEEQVRNVDDGIRKRICTALIRLEDPRAIPALRARRQLNEPYVLEALGKLGDQDSVPELIAQLESDMFDVRLAAAKALQGTPDARAIAPLAAALKRESGGAFSNRNTYQARQMERATALALAATNEPRAATILVDSLRQQRFWQSYNDDYEPEFRYRASHDPRASAIHRMELVAITPLVRELTLPHQQPGDADTDQPRSTVRSREVCAWALSEIDMTRLNRADTKAVESALIAALGNDRERGLQLHAAWTLGRLQSKNAIPELVRVMTAAAGDSSEITDEDIARAEAAPRNPRLAQRDAATLAELVATSLSWIKAPDAYLNFEPLLSHGVANVRKAAIFGLVASKHPWAFERVSRMLTDPEVTVRQTAARQLGFIGDSKAIPLLVELLTTEMKRPVPKPRGPQGIIIYRDDGQNDPRLQTIAMAVQSLGVLQAVTATDELLALTDSEDLDVRSRAVMALVQIGDVRGIGVFRRVMSGTDKQLRERLMLRASYLAMFAGNGFGPKLSHPEARAILRNSVQNDPSTSVRHRGTRALSGLSDDDTIETLVAMCDENDTQWKHLRSVALQVLLTTSFPNRFERLRRSLTDTDAQRRSVAVWEYARLHSGDSEPTDDTPSAADSIAAIAPLLNDSEPRVREMTLLALGRLFPLASSEVEKHVATIRRLSTDDPSAKVRHGATTVLRILKR